MENEVANKAKQSDFFVPNKALPWKDWILDKFLQGMSKKNIHRKLIEEFPEASHVLYHSVCRLLKPYTEKPAVKKAKRKNYFKTKDKRINKSEEIRKLFKEMVENGIQPEVKNIVNTLENRGVKVHNSHVQMVLGPRNNWDALVEKITDKQDSIDKLKMGDVEIADIISARNFIEKVGGVERALDAIKLYETIGPSVCNKF